MNQRVGESLEALSSESPVDQVLETVEPGVQRPASEVALCIADEHPVLCGRILCSFERTGGAEEIWVPCLLHVRPRAGDRVLVLRPAEAAECVVVGVVDGFRRRKEFEPRSASVRQLKADEVVRIEGDDGTPLLEMRSGDAGPVVRFLSSTVTMEAAGALRLEGESVDIVARQGGVHMRATDDVRLEGEQIHLN